jgi:aminoglycoside phosphotransferase (APT) family kinase protein
MTTPDPVMPAAAALALVPGLEQGAPPVRLERLLGGTVNSSWRVDTTQGRFVLRVDGAAWRRPGVDRARERQLHDAAASAGLAPRVLRRDVALGAQVSEFLDGRIWSAADFTRAASLACLGERLATLHELPAPDGVARFDPGACAQQYLQSLASGHHNLRHAQALADAVGAAAQRVDASSRGEGIVHGDLVAANLIEDRALWLLDWEYAQLADPIYDIACLLAYYPAARSHAGSLLAAAGLAAAGEAARLAAAIGVYEGLTALWWLARGEQQPAGGQLAG